MADHLRLKGSAIGSVAAYAANGNDAIQKDTLISVPGAAASADTATDQQGTIQYSKDAYSKADGSQNLAMERWYNPDPGGSA